TEDLLESMDTDQRRGLAPPAAADVVLQLRPEFAHGILHRPAGAVRQAADRRAGHDPHTIADLIKNVQVFEPAAAAADAVGDLQHPAGSLAARRTLAARLVLEKATDVVQHIDDGGRLVKDRDGRGAEAEAANLAGPVEVQRRVELLLGHKAHANAAGDAALGP